jgi:hypothetical protein
MYVLSVFVLQVRNILICHAVEMLRVNAKLSPQQAVEAYRVVRCLDNLLTVNCEILATCSSTYSPVRTSQEAHSRLHKVKLSP